MSFQDGITVITAEWLNGVDSDTASLDSLKYDKVGGTISGDVDITGKLEVVGDLEGDSDAQFQGSLHLDPGTGAGGAIRYNSGWSGSFNTSLVTGYSGTSYLNTSNGMFYWSSSDTSTVPGVDSGLNSKMTLGSDGSLNITLKYTLTHLGDTSNSSQVCSTSYLKSMVDYTTRGLTTIGSQNVWVPSVGIWTVAPGTTNTYLEIYDGSAWRRSSNSWVGGTLITDGSFIRIYNADLTSAIFYYIRQGLQR